MAGKRSAAGEAGGAKKARKVNDTVFARTALQRKAVPEGAAVLRLLSWNVNGLRALLKNKRDRLDRLVAEEKPDVLFLQETKLQDAHAKDLGEMLPGYKSFFSCSQAKKGYSGTALFLNEATVGAGEHRVVMGIGHDGHDNEGRAITLQLPHVNIVGLYVPNAGQKLERLKYRVDEWDRALTDFVARTSKATGQPTVICGDLNVAHKDADLHNPTAKHIEKSAGCTPEERASFSRMLEEADMVDTFRHLYPDAEHAYTYWSTRGGGRPFNRGLRLDYFCVPRPLVEAAPASGARVHDSYVLPTCTEGASDHCPVGLELLLPSPVPGTAAGTVVA